MTAPTIARNPTVELLTNHRSCRRFLDKPVPEDIQRAILAAAFAASSSCFLQVTSIIRVRDPQTRSTLADLAGNQPHVAQAPEFWVFIADNHRNTVLVPESDLGWSEQLVMACVDTGIAAQNAFTAIESFGLGGVYVGGLRNHIAEVARLLQLPANTIPLMGLAFGYPAETNEIKPRLPQSVTVMDEVYREPDAHALARYDAQMAAYYANRKANPKTTTWTADIRRVIERERRPFVDDYLKKTGWLTK